MGNLNEIQKQTTQSYGDNSFTTTIKENTVEFDSAKDSFTFNDEVNVPSLNVSGLNNKLEILKVLLHMNTSIPLRSMLSPREY